MEGVNSTMTYSKNFYKSHNIPPVQQKYDKSKQIIKYEKEEIKKVRFLFSQPIFLQSNQGLGTEVGKSGK
jgi:hypothetical protein